MPTWGLCLVFAASLAAAVQIGFRAGLEHRKRSAEAPAGLSAMEAAVFGLFGLLLALTFSFVIARADARRQLVVDESNAIGTAYLRCDVLPDPLRAELRGRIRAYVDERLALIEAGGDDGRAEQAARRAGELQAEIWSAAARLVREQPGAVAYAIVLEALNEMIDLQTARDAAMRARLGAAIVFFLGATALAAGIVAGYALGLAGQHHPVATASFVLLTSMVTFIVLDIDRPHQGLFRPPIGVLLELRDAMRAGAP